MACCGSPTDEPFFEIVDEDGLSYEEGMAVTSSSSSSSSQGSEAILQTTYSRKTQLFRAIENRQWENVLSFLQTGKWNRSLFQPSLGHSEATSPQIQCRTWVKNADFNQLPLHLAVAHDAPSVVIHHLVETYPDAVKCCDSDDRLPIHLAFSSGATDAVLVCLLRAWPPSCLVNPKPYECGVGARSEIIKLVVQETEAAVKKKREEEWRSLVAGADVGLKEASDLTSVLSQLLADRQQLQDMKVKLKGHFSRKAEVRELHSEPQRTRTSWGLRFGRSQVQTKHI